MVFTKFKMQASTFDVALNQRWLEFNALVEVRQGSLSIALEVSEGGSQIEGKGFEFTKVAKLQGLFEGCGSLIIAITGLQRHCEQTLAQLTLARILAQLNGFSETLGKGFGTEALEVVGHEGGARELLALGFQDRFTLFLRNLLQESLKSDTADLVGEAVDDAAGSEVEKGLAELLEVFICNSSPIQSLDILAIH